MKKLILNLAMLFCFNSLANTVIYCPQELECTKGQCNGLPDQNKAFIYVLAADRTKPIPDGTYYFSNAASLHDNLYQCYYVNNNGWSIAFLLTSKRLMPVNPSTNNRWTVETRYNDYFCNPNSKTPYIANASLCPFIG